MLMNIASSSVKTGSARRARDMRRADLKLAEAASRDSMDDISNELEATPTLELAQEILGNYKMRVQNVRLDFLEHITRESLAFISGQKETEARQRSIDEVMADSMKSVVDEVYTALEPYISAFNKAVACTQLTVSHTRPASVSEIISYDSLRRPVHTISSYRARFSTCSLSIVVRGQHDRVDFFFLPVEQVMALSRIESQYVPIMSFTGISNGSLIDWEVESKPLTSDRLERYCLHLLDYLIEQTRENLAHKRSL